MKKTLICLLFLGILYSCTKDTFEPSGNDCDVLPTYNTNMQAIVDTYCAYSGCHNGTPGVPGDYRTYQGMSIHFDGEIFSRVVSFQSDIVRGMPPDYAVDFNGLPDLSDEDYMLFNCWISAQFPEN